MNPGRGIALKIASTFVFTLMLVCVKAVADTIPPGETVFARSFFALVPIVAMLVWQKQIPQAFVTKRPWVHLSRGAVGVGSMGFNFAALALLPLPESMMIGYAAPLMIVALAALILGERVRLYRWSAVGVGLLGVLVILWPRFTIGTDTLQDTAVLGAVLALLSALFSAFAGIFIRAMVRTEGTGTIVFYFAVNSSLLALLTIPFGWVMPNPQDAALLVLTGLFGGVGQILMTAAYRSADAGTIASFDYVSMLWGIGFAYILFGETPSASVIAGGSIVVAAGIFIILRERSLGLQRKRQRKALPPPPA